MRKLLSLVFILAIIFLAGCGGGGGGSTSSSLDITSSDGKVSVTALAGSFPGVGMTLTSELSTDFTPPLSIGAGQGAFVAAANFTGYSSTFAHPATITFTLSTAVAAGTDVYLYSAALGSDAQYHLTQGPLATISSNRKTVSATITTCANYVLLHT